MINFHDIDWNERRPFSVGGGKIKSFNFNELYERSANIMNNLIYGSFKKWIDFKNDFRQLCAIECMNIYANNSCISSLFGFLKTRYHHAICDYINRIESKNPRISIDAIISDEDNSSFEKYLGSYDFYSEINYSIFTPKELALINTLYAGYEIKRSTQIFKQVVKKLAYCCEKDITRRTFDGRVTCLIGFSAKENLKALSRNYWGIKGKQRQIEREALNPDLREKRLNQDKIRAQRNRLKKQLARAALGQTSDATLTPSQGVQTNAAH